jgi:RNase P/RNase MRP subunit p29
MITLPSLNINKVSITGQVIGVTYYEDSNKLVLTVKNLDGSFCVEFHPLKAEVEITRGDQVMVTGSLFSMRSGRYDAAKIRARLVRVMDLEYGCSE